MAKFGAYNELTTGADGDLALVKDISASETKYITLANLLAYILSKTLTSPYLNEAIALTTTSTELNQLHSQGAVAADFAKLAAIASTAAELSELNGQGAVAADFAKLAAITETAANINKIAGILAGSQALSGLDVNGNADVSGTLNIGAGTTRALVPSGSFSNNANGNPNVSDTTYDVDANVTEGTWESFGPTGSGKTNIWTALDSVPTDAEVVWVELTVIGTNGAVSSSLLSQVYARKNGSSQAAATANTIATAGDRSDSSGNAYGGSRTIYPIPISSRSFDLYWSSTFTTNGITAKLIGWSLNP